MAISAGTVWEVRPTTGSDLNGGGWSDADKGATGVDHTYGAGLSIVSFTDLAAGSGSTTVTSASNPFDNTMLGNVVRIESGTNVGVGYYIIKTFTSAGQVTFDRTPTSGGAMSNGVGKLGGALKSVSQQATKTLGTSITAGNKIWIKNEAWAEVAVAGVAGTGANPILWEGYNSTRGDAPTGTNRPTNDLAGAGIPFTCSYAYHSFKHLIFKGSTNNYGFYTTSGPLSIYNCRFTGNNLAGFALNSASNYSHSLVWCEADNNGTYGYAFYQNQPAICYACVAHDNGGSGFRYINTATLIRCLSYANDTFGFDTAAGSLGGSMIECTADGNDVGYASAAPSILSVIVNCNFTHNTTYGMQCDGPAQRPITVDYNNFHGNGTDRAGVAAGPHDTAIDPVYTDAANGDFSIGAAGLVGAGWPGSFPVGAAVGYPDIGAVQSDHGVAASGVDLPDPLTVGA